MVAPIRVWGSDSTGKIFNVLAHTLDVSSTGARIGGVKVPLGVGDAVTVQYKQQKGLYKVMWVGRPGDKTQDQIGVALLEPERQIWAEIQEPPQYKDTYSGSRKVVVQEPPGGAPPPPETPPPVETPAMRAAERTAEEIAAETDPISISVPGESEIDIDGVVIRCARGLLRIEQLVKRNPPSAPALMEFRDALAKLRQTVWALQQWYEVKDEAKKAFPLLAFLNTERLRFVVQAARDLADDMSDKQVEVDRELLQSLYQHVQRLRTGESQLWPESQGFSFEVSEPAAKAVNTAAAEIKRSSMPPGDAIEFFAGELQRVVGASGIALAGFEGGEMICVGASGNMPGPGTVLEIEVGPGAEAFTGGKRVYCKDTQSDERVDAELCREAQILSVVFVPVLSSEGATVGLIEAVAARTNAFNNDRLEALEYAAEFTRELLARRAAATA